MERKEVGTAVKEHGMVTSRLSAQQCSERNDVSQLLMRRDAGAFKVNKTSAEL